MFPFGSIGLLGGVGGSLVTFINAQIVEIFHTGWTPHVDGYGFDAGSDWWGYAGNALGGITRNNYFDNSSTERFVDSCYWDGLNGGRSLQFSLAGTGIANDSDAFYSILIDGEEFLRSTTEGAGGTYLANNFFDGTTWVWYQAAHSPALDTDPFGAPNTLVPFEVRLLAP